MTDKKITLLRLVELQNVTLGVLILDGEEISKTLERAWDDNKVSASCIPTGIYTCSPHDCPKHRDVWQVENVPGRNNILFHIGNTIADTTGCILPGKSYGILNNEIAVLNSGAAVETMRVLIYPDKQFTLEIKRIEDHAYKL